MDVVFIKKNKEKKQNSSDIFVHILTYQKIYFHLYTID